MRKSIDIDTLAAGVIAADRSAVAQAISLVEDTRPDARKQAAQLLSLLARSPRHGRSHRLGITGPPGVGKSTLINALLQRFRTAGHTVGVLAVDPSSKRSGGALLGDRARITIDPADIGTFVRSLATQGEHGGLALCAPAIVWVLAAAYDEVIIETTGVGQTETDVEHVADTVVLVIQPGSGDVLQFLKAGVMEIPDIIVVNKSDLGALAERAATDVKAALHQSGSAGVPPVVLVSAGGGQGADAGQDAGAGHDHGINVLMTLIAQRAGLDPAATQARRRNGWINWTMTLLRGQIGQRGLDGLGRPETLIATVGAELDAGRSPLEIAAAFAEKAIFTR